MLQAGDFLSFVQLRPFLANWKALGLDDDELRGLETSIMTGPRIGAVIPGTGGVRKLRFAPSRWRTGKSGALRVCYVYFEDLSIVILITAYGKSRQENITAEDKSAMRRLIPLLHAEFSARRK